MPSVKFVRPHSSGIPNGVKQDIAIYGQESNYTTFRLSKMNMAIRGIDAHIEWTDSFLNNKHKDLKADYLLANPPFNNEDWGLSKVKEDARWAFGTPPAGDPKNKRMVQRFIWTAATPTTRG